MSRFARPPVEYLRQCSSTSLRYFEMSKLEHAANLRRELAVLLDEMMEETALALLARWMPERRERRSADPAPPGDARGRSPRSSQEQLAGWLANTRQVELAAPPATPASAKPRGGHSGVSPGKAAKAPPAPAQVSETDQGAAAPADTARADRRTEHKGVRTTRPAQRASGDGPGTVPPKQEV